MGKGGVQFAPLRVEKSSDSRKLPSTDDDASDDSPPYDPKEDYARHGILAITKSRVGWLITFVFGLLLSALIVQRFEDLLEHHVQLSFFVPLVMGHGGNTGSQTVSTIIRALALHQITQRDLWRVVIQESVAGGIMGALIGAGILLLSLLWPNIGVGVGLTVAVALPVISLWANGVGAVLTMLADRFKFDPAVTSVPLMTTIVDATGLIIYFYIATIMLDIDLPAAHAAAASAAVAGAAAAATAAQAASGAATAGQATAMATAAAAAGKAAGQVLQKLMSPPPPKKKGKGHGFF